MNTPGSADRRHSHGGSPKRPARRERRLILESLEGRWLLAADLAALDPAQLALDVNGDSAITPLDALTVTNEINRSGAGAVAALPGRFRAALDVNRDGLISPLDNLQLVNHLNRYGSTALNAVREWADRLPEVRQEQRENLQQLLTELNQLRVRSEVTPEQVAQIVEGAVDVLRGGREGLQTVVRNVQSIAAANGVNRDDIQAIVGSVRAVVDEFLAERPLGETVGDEVRQLVHQLADLGRELQIDPDQLQRLGEDLAALVDSVQQPDPTTLRALAAEFRSALEDREVSDAEREVLAERVDAALTSAGVSREQIQTVVADVESILDDLLPLREELPPLAGELVEIGRGLLGRLQSRIGTRGD